MGLRGLLCLAAFAVLCPADDVELRAEFEKGLSSVRKRVERRQWKRAREQLDRLLEKYAGQPFVLPRRIDIADLMKQCRFREEHGVPDPKKMVAGRLINYNLATGKIKIRYKSPVPRADFIDSRNLLIHRARFKGPHKISFDVPYGIAVVVCVDDKRAYLARVSYKSAEVLLLGKGNNETIATGSYPKLRPRDPRRPSSWRKAAERLGKLEVRVHRRSIDVWIGSKRIVKADKPAEHWGHWGVLKTQRTGEMTVHGQAEPSWIQGMIDKEDQKRLRRFESGYRAADHLPAWLFRRAPSGRSGDRDADRPRKPDGRQWPATLSGVLQRRLDQINEVIAEGRPEQALVVLDQGAAGLPPLVHAYARATTLEELGRHAEALKECAKVCDGDAEFVPARVQRARLLRRLGRVDDAVTAYAELLDEYPGGAELHASAALFFVECGRADQSRRALTDALENGLNTKELRQVNALVTKALNGPSFGRRFEHESRHYRIVTDIDMATAKRSARLLERAYDLYTETLDDVDDAERRRFTVYLFGGQAGYLKYARDVFGYASPRSAGLYSLTLKQLLIWNLPERGEMLRTIRHEGFHQYVDRLIQRPPLWFNEGIAEYYEAADLVRGKLTTGRIVDRHVEYLRKKGLVPLAKLLHMKPREFMRDPTRHYGQSWAFIHFLRHTTPERAQLFRRFWDAFRKYPSNNKAMLHALRGESISKLDTAFQRWFGSQ